MKQFEGVKGGKYYLVDNLQDFEKFYLEAKKQRILAVDTETTGLNWVRSDACGLVFGWGVESNFYLPIAHRDNETEELLTQQLDIEDIRSKIQKLLGNRRLTTLWWNAKYDLHILRKLDIEVLGQVHDGVTISFLLDENIDHSLKYLAKAFIDNGADYFEKELDRWRVEEARRRRKLFSAKAKELATDYKQQNDIYTKVVEKVAEQVNSENIQDEKKLKSRTSQLINKYLKDVAQAELLDRRGVEAKNKKDDISYDLVPLDVITPYACADTHYTYLLWKSFFLELQNHSELFDIYRNTEQHLTKALLEMEHNGAKIDVPWLQKLGPQLEEEVVDLEEKIFEDIGYKFNINSPQQLVKALKDKGIKLTKLTKKSKELVDSGQPYKQEDLRYSADAKVIEKLAAKHKFAENLNKRSKLQKLKTGFVDQLLELRDEYDYVHPTVNLNVRSGRSSQKTPNLQNLPAKDTRIRRAFVVPDDDHVYILIDFSQIELRLLALESQDPELLACYPFVGKEKDVHSLSCSEIIYGIGYEEFLEILNDDSPHDPNNPICWCDYCQAQHNRKLGKTFNFAAVFQVGPSTLQEQISTPDNVVPVDQCKLYIDRWYQKYNSVRKLIKQVERHIWDYGYIKNAFGRVRRFPDIRKLPQNQKYGAFRQGFNFIIQSFAAEIFKVSLVRINKILQKSRIKLVNVVHDEIQLYVPKDQIHLIKDIKNEMEDWNLTVPIVADVSYSLTNWAEKKEIKL